MATYKNYFHVQMTYPAKRVALLLVQARDVSQPLQCSLTWVDGRIHRGVDLILAPLYFTLNDHNFDVGPSWPM